MPPFWKKICEHPCSLFLAVEMLNWNIIFVKLSTVSFWNYQRFLLPEKTGDGETFIEVAQKIPYPGYRLLFTSDLALLRLKKPASVNPNVGYACLPPDPDETFEGVMMTISGWGSQKASRPFQFPETLMAAKVKAISNSECSEVYRKASGIIRDSNICAKADKFASDSCKYDSGGKYIRVIVSHELLQRWDSLSLTLFYPNL